MHIEAIFNKRRRYFGRSAHDAIWNSITCLRESRHGRSSAEIPKKSVKFLVSVLPALRDRQSILFSPVRNNIEIQSVVPADKSKPRRRSSSIIGLYPCSHFPLIYDTEIKRRETRPRDWSRYRRIKGSPRDRQRSLLPSLSLCFFREISSVIQPNLH